MCDHKTVVRERTSNGPMWSCTNENCAEMFVPIGALQRIEQENDRIIDMVTGVFTATLWGLHQQAAEAGQRLTVDGDALAAAVCEDKGHDRDPESGKCKRCGNSPFLGQED